MLHPNQILSRRDISRHRNLDAIFLPQTPVAVLAGTALAHTTLPELEPVAGAIIAGDGRAGGGLGHVDEAGAGVFDELVVEELETDLVAGGDGVGF